MGTMGVALPYALIAGGPHQAWLIAAAATGVIISSGLGLAATFTSLGARRRRPVMLAYSAAHIIITVVLGIADGGADSPMALGFFGTFTFVAYTMPPGLLRLYGGLNVAGYLTVYALAGAQRPAYVPVALAGLMATATACALQHQGLVAQRRKLAVMALTDPLTGCLNRRGFEERLVQALADPCAERAGVGVLVVDLDDFKAVNDRRGHAAGDALLVDTAATMRAALGPAAAVGRTGGDEFAVVLTGTPEHEAHAAAVAVRTALADRSPASVGVAVLGADGRTAEALLGAADRRLYAQKSARRAATAA
jgi:diguanylate cyclase (GGDEF)-like protein